MKKKILSCIVSLALSLTVAPPLWAQRTDPPAGNGKAPRKESKKAEIEYPLYNGTLIGIELWGPGGHLLGSDFLSSEISAVVNLRNRYLPTLELGYGTTDTRNEKEIQYKSSAPYFRIGMDYNTLYKKKHGNMLLVGLRYGASSFKFDVEAPGTTDPIYGGTAGNAGTAEPAGESSPRYAYQGMKGSMHWAEFNVGIRTHVWKALYMGWALRFKFKLSATVDEHGDPWYVPGFGKYGSSTLGVTYTITYKLPL